MRAPRLSPFCGFLLFSVAITFGCAVAADTPALPEGVYAFRNGYQSETLELRDGRFRYWFWTDYGADNGDSPFEGTYSVEGSTLTLHRDDIYLGKQRIIHPIRGMDALWQPYALERWLSKGEINAYGVIARLPQPPDDLSNTCLPIPPEVCAALRP